MRLAAASVLPPFSRGGVTTYHRLAVIVSNSMIEHVFYPVFPSERHAEVVLEWLETHPD